MPSLWQGFKSWFRADAGGGTPVSPFDDRFYPSSAGYGSASGQTVTPELALRLAAVYSCVRVCAETIASLPLIIYQRLPDGGKKRAVDHPLYEVLHDKPNLWQTSFEFIEMMQAHLELRGNAFALIVPGPRGAVDALIPLHPDRVQVYRLPNGRLRYTVRDWYTGELQHYAQEEILHLRGWSSDGMVGMSTISLARESIGGGLGMQEYAARFFENDSRPGGVLTTPQTMSPEATERVRQSWQEAQSGANRHKVALLEQDLTYKAISVSNKDSQFLEAKEFNRVEIASLFRVPPHKIADLSRATFSNIEQQNIEFYTDCIRPRVVRWERRIKIDLIDPLDLDENEYFCEFLMDAIIRGDLKSRYDSYTKGRFGGWLSPNDICRMENLNPIAKEDGGDTYLQPANMIPSGSAPPADPIDPGVAQEDAQSVSALHAELVSELEREHREINK
jgi:HK97 family phage portal protein